MLPTTSFCRSNEVYSILLGGYGVLSIWATIWSLRGQRSGFWLNTIMLGIAQLAIVYGLIIPGRLTGPNAYARLVLYLLGVVLGGVGFLRLRSREAGDGEVSVHRCTTQLERWWPISGPVGQP